MDVSPMSLQMVVPRSAEVGQVQSNLNQQVNIQQDFQAIEQKADDRLKEQQVRHKDNPEDGRIKEEGEHHGGAYAGSGRRGSGSQEEESQEEYASDPNRGTLLDIRL